MLCFITGAHSLVAASLSVCLQEKQNCDREVSQAESLKRNQEEFGAVRHGLDCCSLTDNVI